MLKVKCAVCGITKPSFCPDTKTASLSEGTGLFGDFASIAGSAFMRNGVPHLAKKD